ncbi:hypothetical protein M3Y95_01095300 [Aphelenchoides besseyi]|nr:hypothetical protein M3Y95_01095300 [Aphelenchoides besseyi]
MNRKNNAKNLFGAAEDLRSLPTTPSSPAYKTSGDGCQDYVLDAFFGGRSEVKLEPSRLANVPIFFIVGGPSSGKSTQCEKIVAKYGLTHLSSGDLCREEVKLGSKRGSELAKIMEAGELVPLEIVLDLIKEAMVKAIGKESKGFLIEGYPREVKQGDQFEAEIQPCKLVIFFDVSEKTLVNRWKQRRLTSGRVDDKVKSIKKRLQTFNTATQPVVDHYIQKQNDPAVKTYIKTDPKVFIHTEALIKAMDSILAADNAKTVN